MYTGFCRFIHAAEGSSFIVHAIQEKKLRLNILIILAIFTQSVYGFEFEGGRIEIPQSFEGPISQDMAGQAKVYGFKRVHDDGVTGTLLQISVFDPGKKFPALSYDELKKGAGNYLSQILGGVERRRQGFAKSGIQYVEISGIPVAKVAWTGLASSEKMEGVMYCYIYNSKIISLHTQDFTEYKGQYLSQAVHAFENIKINK